MIEKVRIHLSQAKRMRKQLTINLCILKISDQ